MEKMDLNSITERIWPINACVATTGEGVVEGIKWLIETVSKIKKTKYGIKIL